MRSTIERVGFDDALLIEVRPDEIGDPAVAVLWKTAAETLKTLRAMLKVSDELDEFDANEDDPDPDDEVIYDTFAKEDEEETKA